MRRTRRTDDRRAAATRTRRVVALVVAIALVAFAVPGSAVAGAAGTGTAGSAVSTGPGDESASSQGADSSFVVSLEDDGDATAAIVVSFDLTDAADREAFEALQANETKRTELETRTEQRFRSIVDDAETDREMGIDDARVSFETVDDGDRGVVTVTATWTGFAATDGDRLTLSEPLASGFAAEQPFVLELPEGYELERATPTPSQETADRVSWDADTSLEGFEAVVVPSSGADSDGGDSQPAPGFVAVPLAIGAGVWLHRRR